MTSCKILNINLNFLAALAFRKGWFQTLLLPLSNSHWGFPLSQVSVVLPSAKNVVNAFFCFVLSPIVAVTKTQLFGQILSKPGCESNILVILFNFCPSLTTSINLYATSTFFMLDNVFQRTIYTLASITIIIYETDIHFQNWRWHRSNPTYVTSFETNYLKLALFTKIDHSLMNRRIDKSRKNRDEETK